MSHRFSRSLGAPERAAAKQERPLARRISSRRFTVSSLSGAGRNVNGGKHDSEPRQLMERLAQRPLRYGCGSVSLVLANGDSNHTETQIRELSLERRKSAAEDKMVGCYPHCTFNLNARAASIDTPLHSFVPYAHVDHMHPNSVIAVAASRRSKELTREIFGGEIGWTPWLRPGFELGLELQRICEQNPRLKGVILGQHGLINWAQDDKACYDLTLDLVEKAAVYIDDRDKGEKTFGGEKHQPLTPAARDELLYQLLPWLRGEFSRQKRFIATIQTDPVILRFVN